MDFIERLSTIEGKQHLFKQDDGTYYNRYVGEYQSQTEAEGWLIDVFRDTELETPYEEYLYTVEEFYNKCLDGTIGTKRAYGYYSDEKGEHFPQQARITCMDDYIAWDIKRCKEVGYTHVRWYSR